MSALDLVIPAVQRAVRELPGLTASGVPDYVPEQMNIDPSVFVYPGSGDWYLGGMTANGLRGAFAAHTLTIRLHVFRGTSVAAQAKIIPYNELVPLQLLFAYQRDHFEGTIVCLGDGRNPSATAPIRYIFQPDDIADVSTLSYLFQLTVTVQEEVAANA